jgi:hypothetical protein
MELRLDMVAFKVIADTGEVHVRACAGPDSITHPLTPAEARELAGGLYHEADEADRQTAESLREIAQN